MPAPAEPGRRAAMTTVNRRLAVRLIIASVLGIVGAILSYLLMRRTSLGERFDASAYAGSLPINPAVLGGTELRRITGDSLAVVLVILLLIGLVRRRPLLGAAAAFAAGITVLITDVLKDDVFNHPFFNPQVRQVANTFPSGHTAAAVGCAMALTLVSPPRWRCPVTIGAGAYGCITAVQSQTTSSHRPSDVVAAAFLAFAAVAGVAGLLAWFRPVRFAPNRYYAISQAVLGVVGFVAAGLTVWGLAVVLSWLRVRAVSNLGSAAIQHDAFLTGVALSVATVVGLLMALLALLGDAELG